MDKFYEKEFDPEALVEEIVRNELDLEIISSINDKDMVKAPNSLTFVHDKKFLGLSPFPRQIEIMLNLFEEFCPDCSNPHHVQDGYLCNFFDQDIGDVLDNIQLLDSGVCPKCKKTQLEFTKGEIFHNHYELAGCAGQRGGKSVLIAMLSNYVLHRFLCLNNPSEFYGLLPNSTLHLSFLALTAKQAEKTLWQPFKDFYDQSAWFQEYNLMLRDYEKKLGKQILHNKPTYFFYLNKRLFGGFDAPDRRKLRGPTRFLSSIDEIGWFDIDAESEKVTLNAEEVHTALKRSLSTIRTSAQKLRKKGILDVPDAYDFNISSPSDANDKIMRNVKAAQRDKRIYAFHYATWEMNPNMTYEDLSDERISGEATDRSFDFDRDFGAIPPLGSSPFISASNSPTDAENVVTRIMDESSKISPVATMSTEVHVDDFGHKSLFGKASVLITDKMTPRVLAVDTGYNYCSFAVVLAHYDIERDRAVVDFIAELMPDIRAKLAIHYPLTFEHLIMKLAEKLNIVLAFYDRFNSLDQMQRLRDMKVKADSWQLRWEDFLNFRSYAHSNRLFLPKPEIPLSVLKESSEPFDKIVRDKPNLNGIYQMMTVRESGRKVLKPSRGMDDIFRAIVLATLGVLNNTKLLAMGGHRLSRGGVLGAYRTYTGGTGGQQVGRIQESGIGTAAVYSKKRN